MDSKNIRPALWERWCRLIHRLGLFFWLICIPAHAMYTGFNDVPFHGEGQSEGRTLIITFRPEIQSNLIAEAHTQGTTGFLDQAQVPQLLPVDYVPAFTPLPDPVQVVGVSWPTLFAFAIALANKVHITPENAIHAEFTLAENDGLFGRFSGAKFRYQKHKTLRLSNQVVYRLIFTRIDADGMVWTIHIDLFQNPAGTEDPFTVHAFHLLVSDQIVDGFHTQAHQEIVKRAIDEKNTRKRKPPEPKPEPPKEDKPDDEDKKSNSGRKRDASHLRLNHGYNGGGNAYAIDFIRLDEPLLARLKLYAVWWIVPGIFGKDPG